MDKQMTVKRGLDLLRQNFISYLAGILIILGIKLYYRQADCDSLLWILAPTVWWVELLSKIPFTYLSGTGYVNHSLRLLIAPSCSGVRFMTIVFATLVFSFVHIFALHRESPASASAQSPYRDYAGFGALNAKTQAKGLVWVAASAFLSWLLTVFVNGLRIIAAIYLPLYLEEAGLMKGILTQDRLHTMIGVAVYFTALLTIYRLTGWFVRREVRPVSPVRENDAQSRNLMDTESDNYKRPIFITFLRKCVPPVFWYFVLTLGLPFLNRVNRGGKAEFAEFAALVTGCCAVIMIPYIIMLLCRRQR